MPQGIQVYSGDTLTFTISAVQANGQPYDLTSAQNIEYGIGETISGSPVFTANLTAGISVNSPPSAGIFTVTVPPSATEGFATGAYYNEAVITTEAGIVATCYTGWLLFQMNGTE